MSVCIPVATQFFNGEVAEKLTNKVKLDEVTKYFAKVLNHDFAVFNFTAEVFFVPMPMDDKIAVGILNPDDPAAHDLFGVKVTPLTYLVDNAPTTWKDFMSCDEGNPGFGKFTGIIKALESPPLHMKKYDIALEDGTPLRFKVHSLQPYLNLGGQLVKNDMLVDGGLVCTVEIMNEGLEFAKVSGLQAGKTPVLVPSNPAMKRVVSEDVDIAQLKPYLKDAHYKMPISPDGGLIGFLTSWPVISCVVGVASLALLWFGCASRVSPTSAVLEPISPGAAESMLAYPTPGS